MAQTIETAPDSIDQDTRQKAEAEAGKGVDAIFGGDLRDEIAIQLRQSRGHSIGHMS